MTPPLKPPHGEDPWEALRRFTRARIALGRAGGSLPTAPLLEFQLAHARARDAVHRPFDAAGLARAAAAFGAVIEVHSAAENRDVYLRRPDLGRRLAAPSRQRLLAEPPAAVAPEIVFVLADGLSALAVEAHALAVLEAARAPLAALGFGGGPLVIARQARVALGDEIGALLGARQVAVLIGERPGLSSADSLGIYLTHAPRVGRPDAERNCISNIHPDGGLSPAEAARKLVWLMREARARQLSGVQLKDDSDAPPLLDDAAPPALVRPPHDGTAT